MLSRVIPVVAVAGLLPWVLLAGMADEPGGPDPAGFALVELFTSEGCSSCPPADRLAGAIARKARTEDAPVYVVAFHVDYWDRLGWPDRFASAEFTKRQHRYAEATNSDRVYTPQMIVNGRVEFVGSDKRRAERAIAESRRRPAEAALRITTVAGDTRLTATIRVHTKRDAEHLVVNAVVVEDGLTTEVKRGENNGRRLDHDAVARGFATVPATTDVPVTITVEVPAEVVREHAALVVFLQDTQSMAILAAARRPLPAARSEPPEAG
jgi:hypothetical protein